MSTGGFVQAAWSPCTYTRSVFIHSHNSSEEDSSSTVEALLFSPAEQNLLITGSLEGLINVWDLSSQVGVSKVYGTPYP